MLHIDIHLTFWFFQIILYTMEISGIGDLLIIILFFNWSIDDLQY